MKRLFIYLFLLVGGLAQAQAQEPDIPEHLPKIRGAAMLAYSHVPKATSDGEKSISVIPAWGVDLDYYFHRRWSIAVQADIKLQSFEIEEDNILLERNNPFSLALGAHYHALRHWSFYLAAGKEFEKIENLFLVKVGTEYSFEISEKFEIALNFVYENRDDVYDGLTFGVAFNKLLWIKERKTN